MQTMAESNTGGEPEVLVAAEGSSMPAVEGGTKRKASEEVVSDDYGKKVTLEGRMEESGGLVSAVVTPQKSFPRTRGEVAVAQSQGATSGQSDTMNTRSFKDDKAGSEDLQSKSESKVCVAAPVVSPKKPPTPASAAKASCQSQHNEVLCGSCKTFRDIAAMEKYFQCNNLGCNGRIQDFFRDDVNTGEAMGVYPNVTLEQKNCMEALRKQTSFLVKDVLTTRKLSKATVGRLWKMRNVAKAAAIFDDDSYKAKVTEHVGLVNALSNMERALERKDKVAFRGFYHTAMYMILVGYSHVNEEWKKEGGPAHHSAWQH